MRNQKHERTLDCPKVDSQKENEGERPSIIYEKLFKNIFSRMGITGITPKILFLLSQVAMTEQRIGAIEGSRLVTR